MRYYTEVICWRGDGLVAYDRIRVKNYDTAKAVAKEIATLAFSDQIWDGINFGLGLAPLFVNDMGEFVRIQAVIYGEMAQVREGRFLSHV